MPVSYPPLPLGDDLRALFRAAFANAEDLLADAQLLLKSGRFPRAYGLATLSWEELSKGQLCLLAMVLPEITPEDFWERFRDHEGKLGRVHLFADFMHLSPIGPMAEHARKVMGEARSTQNQKLRGLYVEYRRGKILLPSQIGERAARNQIKTVKDALDFAAVAFAPGSLDEEIAQVGALLGGLQNAMVAEPDELAAAMQIAMHGGPQDRLQTLIYGHAAIDVE